MLLDELSNLPAKPGVYFFYDAERLLYIGQSVNLRQRVKSYLRERGGHSARTARIRLEATRVAVQPCGSDLEAALTEARLIKAHLPPYNVRGRRSRHIPFLKIVDETFPRVVITYQLLDDGSRYVGPFRSEQALRAILDILRTLTPYRHCHPLPKRHCIEYGIGRCPAPCENRIDESGYLKNIDDLLAFLNGSTRTHIDSLHTQMQAAAVRQAFERAAILRDRIRLLEKWQQHRAIWGTALLEENLLVVLPSRDIHCQALYLIRRGRLCFTNYVFKIQDLPIVAESLRQKLAAPAPGIIVSAEDFDDIQIIAGWLHRHARDPNVFPVTSDTLTHTLRIALNNRE